MKPLVYNRLTVLGPRKLLTRFTKSEWERRMQARYFEWIEHSKGRFIGQFESEAVACQQLQQLSSKWPELTFLLYYEDEEARRIGAAMARAGLLEHQQIPY